MQDLKHSPFSKIMVHSLLALSDAPPHVGPVSPYCNTDRGSTTQSGVMVAKAQKLHKMKSQNKNNGMP